MHLKKVAPSKEGFTVYSITGCKYCNETKKILKTQNLKIINCDKYMGKLRERDEFYSHILKYTKYKYLYFPMIFCNGIFVGGYKELLKALPKP